MTRKRLQGQDSTLASRVGIMSRLGGPPHALPRAGPSCLTSCCPSQPQPKARREAAAPGSEEGGGAPTSRVHQLPPLTPVGKKPKTGVGAINSNFIGEFGQVIRMHSPSPVSTLRIRLRLPLSPSPPLTHPLPPPPPSIPPPHSPPLPRPSPVPGWTRSSSFSMASPLCRAPTCVQTPPLSSLSFAPTVTRA